MVTTVNKKLVIHDVPLDEIKLNEKGLIIELDDINEERWELVFSPVQDIKITSYDCYGIENMLDSEDSFASGRYQRYLLEIKDSERIKELRTQLADPYDDFLVNSRHFYLDLRDNIVEIIAWNVEMRKLEKK